MMTRITPRLFLATAFLLLSLAGARAAQAAPVDHAAINQAAVQTGDRLVSEFENLTKQLDSLTASGADPAALGRTRKALAAKALEISQTYQAKLKLKKAQFKGLGARYHDLMKGADGKGGILAEVLKKARKKLAGKYPPEVWKKIQLIQNQKSLAAKKAPMDVDAGLLVTDKAEAKKLMKALGGPGGVDQFHRDLQDALESSYKQVAQSSYGVNVSPQRAYIEGTTIWHPEAYLDAEVLKQGGVAQRSLIQQTADVSKFKVNRMVKAAAEGKLPLGEALTEAARGTYKDLDKVERVFDEIARQTGVRPRWSRADQRIKSVLDLLSRGKLDPLKADRMIQKLTGGRQNLFQACNGLIDRMEEAVRMAPSPRILKARFYKNYLSGDDLRKALRSLVEKDLDHLPQAAKALDRKLAQAAGVYMVSLERLEPKQLIEQLRKQMKGMNFKSSDEAVEYILKHIYSSPHQADIVFFGPKAADALERVRKLTDPAVKTKAARRFLKNHIPLQVVDKNTRKYMQLGEPGSGLKAMGLDAIVGAATAIYQTGAIMDQNLPPEEENRQIMNAWVTALPMVGDFAQAIIDGVDAYYEGSRGKAVQAGIFLTIGAAYAVPGLQVPAVAASLGMAAWQIGGSAWTVYKDKSIVWAWVDSGKWDRNQGIMLGLVDAKNQTRPTSPPDAAFKALIENGDIGYHSGLAGVTISQSVCDYAERTLLADDKNFEISKLAIHNLYPGFDLDKNLPLHINAGRTALAVHIRDHGGSPRRDLAMALFVKLKKNVYDKAAEKALEHLKAEAEAEYQAKFLVGAAAQVFQDLQALAARLHLPLVKHVNVIYDSFLRWSFENVKSPWVRHSIPRRHVDLARRYLKGYLAIEESLTKISELFKKAGLRPPKKHHLTGYLEIDSKRIDDLARAYQGALAQAHRDAQAIYRQVTGANGRMDMTDPCNLALFQKLANIQVRLVFVRDRMLLMDQWMGKKSAAEKSRDAALQQALDAVDRKQPVLTAVWQKLSSSYEEAYSWANLKWEGSQVMADARDLMAKRLEKMTKQYEEAKAEGAKGLADCAGKVLVHLLRRDPQGGADSPISGASVTLKGQGAAETLIEAEKGDYATDRPAPGQYTVTAQADGYQALDGKPEAAAPLTIPQPAPGQPVSPAELTIHMTAANQPKLEVKFTKADAGAKPKLELAVTSPKDDLKPDSLRVSLEGKVIACQVSGAGKALVAQYEFDAPLSPGRHRVEVKVTDVMDIEYELGGDFTYVVSLEVAGYTVDDQGGRPEDKRPNSGETVKLALKLKTFEPGPLKDLVLTCPAADPRLTPVKNDKWAAPSLMPGQETVSSALELKAGEVKPPHEGVRLMLKGSLQGRDLGRSLPLEVTVYPGFLFSLEMADKVSDPKAQGTPNNGDGKAQAGESIGLVLKITNLSDKPSPPYRVELSCQSDLITLGEKEIKGAPLQGKQTITVQTPAQVSAKVTKGVTARIQARFLPEGDPKGKAFSLPLRLEPPPLNIKILNVKVEDPQSGSLTTRNDGNGRLGSGEYAYLTIQLVNQGPMDLGSMHFDLKGPGAPLLTIIKPSSTAAGTPMPSRQPASIKFELDLSPDYSQNSLKLDIKGREAVIQSAWEGSFTLPVDVKTAFKSEMKLFKPDGAPVQPGDLAPGAAAAWKLTISSQAQKEFKGLSLGLSSPSVSLTPNQFPGQGFPPGAKREYQGKLVIPGDFKQDAFAVRLDVTDAAGSKTLHRNRFVFKLGGEATKIVMKPQAPPQGGKDWKVKLQVRTKAGKAVDAGQVVLKANQGKLSADKLDMAGGEGDFTWTPPPNFTAQALIEAAYSGDELDPAKPDRKYLPSTGNLILPPQLGAATRVELRSQMVNRGPNWRLTVQVVDDKGAYVKEGVLEVSLDLGAVSGAGVTGTSGRATLTGRPLVFTWAPPGGGGPAGQGKIVFSYLGDQEDPAKPDLKYAPSRAQADLPPLEKPTLTVTPGLIDQGKGIWRLEVKLTDSLNRPIGMGAVVEFTADGGSFESGASLLKAEKTLQNGTCIKGWRQTDQDQHTITVRYPGDRKGPGGGNLRYQAAEDSIKLPPHLIARSTIFVVDASGSMGGAKLAQAKAAVRAALGGIPADQTDEEFALIVFAGCGNVKVYQGFTTNPRRIISRLTFRAGGGTPIAQALGAAARYMRSAGRGQTGRIILLSDGGESCRGKPVEAAKGIHRSVRSATPGGARQGGRP